MVAVKKDLYIEQGATFQFWFRWLQTDSAGAPTDPVDITGWTARMDIRRSQKAPAYVSASTSTGQITITGDQGLVQVKLASTTTDLILSKTCLYDLELVSPAGDVYRMLQGKVTVDPNITQVETDSAVT